MLTVQLNVADLHGRCSTPRIYNLARHCIVEKIFPQSHFYKQLKNQPHLSQDLIKWQENWQACDQLQMNGSVLEKESLSEISEVIARLLNMDDTLLPKLKKKAAYRPIIIYTVSVDIL